MSFKKNLLAKIQVDRMARLVLASLAAAGESPKVDRAAMKWLLDLAGYTLRQVRDLDLYMPPETLAAGRGLILVLDNELKVYDTTVDDVAMRKSPLIKEMLSIRNAIKILNDQDVAVSRKEATLERLRSACIAGLDLSFGPGDLADMSADGKAALEGGQSDAVVETLDLFAEMLAYQLPPKALRLDRHHVLCARSEGPGGQAVYGPLVVYSLLHNTLRLVDMRIGTGESEKLEAYERIAAGREKPTLEGAEVFDYLKQRVGAYPRPA